MVEPLRLSDIYFSKTFQGNEFEGINIKLLQRSFVVTVTFTGVTFFERHLDTGPNSK